MATLRHAVLGVIKISNWGGGGAFLCILQYMAGYISHQEDLPEKVRRPLPHRLPVRRSAADHERPVWPAPVPQEGQRRRHCVQLRHFIVERQTEA